MYYCIIVFCLFVFRNMNKKKDLEKISLVKRGHIYFYIYFHRILVILIHMVSDFNLIYIKDVRIRKMNDFSSLIAILSSTLWKHSK